MCVTNGQIPAPWPPVMLLLQQESSSNTVPQALKPVL